MEAIVKLNSGEMLACDLTTETETTLTISFPMLFTTEKEYSEETKTIIERTAIVPFCPFIETRIIKLNKISIMFCEPMKTNLIPAYKTLVETSEVTLNKVLSKEQSDTFYIQGSNLTQ